MLNERYFIAKWSSILYRYGQSYIGKQLETYGIGSGQFVFLIILFKNNGISQENMSERLKIDKATTAKSIRKLEDAGYVERIVDSEDKRAYKVFLTSKALDIKPFLQKVLTEWEKIITDGLSKDEKKPVSGLLEKMAGNAVANTKKSKR